MEKLIKLKGRIDSSNASEVEKEINDEIGNHEGSLKVDVGALEYISSAGLRIILRLKKKFSNTKIVNCLSEVYEIFDMTGFTEMMDISKAYREISVEGCEVIGEGANGIVYRTDPDTIVKVYKSPDSLEEIHNERRLARKAFVMGIPTAISYDVVKVGEYYGAVFELLNAQSFNKLIADGVPVEQLAKESVDILKIIHSKELEPGELPSKREEAVGWGEYVREHLPEDVGTKLVELFKDIPETNTMLHGDYHIKNIMKQNGENLLIDMDTLSMGHPIYEFAAIFAAYKGFSCYDPYNCSNFLGITVEQTQEFLDYTFKYYFEGESQEKIDEIIRMSEIICYTRIMRRQIKHFSVDDPEQKPVIDFCRNYLIENVPVTDKLYY